MLKVSTGVIVRADGRILLTQRGQRSDYAYRWECPGGKANAGEEPIDALIRELAEEVGYPAWAHASTLFEHRAVLRAPEVVRDVEITFFSVVNAPRWWSPSVRLNENVIGVGWFLPGEMDGLRLIPGNVRLLEHLRGGAPVDRS